MILLPSSWDCHGVEEQQPCPPGACRAQLLGLQACGAENPCDPYPVRSFLGGCHLHFQSHRAPHPLAWELATLGCAIPAPKRASGYQRTAKIGRARVLLSLKPAHKRIADLILVRPRTLCSSLKRKSREKLVFPSEAAQGEPRGVCHPTMHHLM